MRLNLLAASLVSLALAPAVAQADTRYAEPGGNGPAATCPQADPCSIASAVENAAVADGDVILLAAGTYDAAGIPGNGLDANQEITIRPIDPANRPVITAPGANQVVQLQTGASITDVEIRQDGTETALSLVGGVAERIVARGGNACSLFASAVLRDSICLGASGLPAVAATATDPNEVNTVALSNVTAVATQPGAQAYGVLVAASDTNASETLVAGNVIAYGLAPDGDVRAEKTPAATAASFEATASNYDLVSQMGGASITSPGAESGQTALPLFANLAGGDVHQAAGSPTIDAGSSEIFGFSSTFDVDRDPRTVGSAPDIGGDEFVPAVVPPDTTAPNTSLTKKPKKKVRSKKKRKRAKFAFTSTEAGSSFTCTLDGKDFACDSGDFAKKVKRGKHKFEVAATDPAGNADDSPATYSWKLKRKR